MKEGLRASTLCQRQKVTVSPKIKNGKKKVSSMVSGDLVCVSDTAICSTEIEVVNKEIESEDVECGKNDSFGVNEGANCHVNTEVDADKIGNKVVIGLRGRKRKNEENSKEYDDQNSDIGKKKGSPLNLNESHCTENLVSSFPNKNIEEERCVNEHVECKSDGDDFGLEVSVNANIDVNANSNGDNSANTSEICNLQSGRRTDAESKMNVDDCIGEVVEEIKPPLVSNCTEPFPDSGGSVPGREVKSDHVDIEYNKGVDASVYANGSADTSKGKQKISKGRRGRKRKSVESSECNEDIRVGRKKVNDGALQVTGRILRSRTVLDIELKECDVGGKINMETDCLDNEKMDAEKDVSAPSNGRLRKKLKGRRGRPPKVQGRNLAPEVNLKDGMPGKKMKGRRGRPPKLQESNLAPKVQNKLKIKGIKKTSDRKKREGIIENSKSWKLHNEQRASDINDSRQKVTENSYQTKVKDAVQAPEFTVDGKQNKLTDNVHHAGKNTTKKIKTSKDNRKDEMGRREQQQLVREQIICILMKAGWTVDLRPRQSRNYIDAVYVDCEGRTYWSVTLAYDKLKKKVEKGDADSKTIAAFAPIPEDLLSKLFRVSKKKGSKLKGGGGKSGSTTGKQNTGKQSSKKKNATKCIGGLNNKVVLSFASKAVDKSSKIKGYASACEQDYSAGSSHREMPRSDREIIDGRNPLALLVRSAANGSDPDGDGFVPYNGKRSLLSWMIDLGTATSGAKVKCMDNGRTKVLTEGKITRDGILCGCCNNIVTISDFLSHAGTGVSHDSHPLNDIYLGSGISLLQCLLHSWSKQEEATKIRFGFVNVDCDDPNDDTCNICGDGGDLICCDGCPSTFHQSCLDIENFPSGDWRCIFCSCKFCETTGGNFSKRDDSNCSLPSELLTCRLCEEKFHQLCIPGEEAVKVNSTCIPFCGKKCRKLFEQLRVLLGVKQEMPDGFSWTLLQHCDVSQDAAPFKIECNAKLAVAFSIMDECFCPIVDQRSGINTIHNVIYSCGSNFSRLNYSGFFTVILERGDEIISAASIRIHGNQLAEMPFIGTRHIYRRQGMCRRLLYAIELALGSLDVEKLVIPAISELHETWTSVFGFKPLEDSKRKEMKQMSMIVFPGTDLLQKPTLKDQLSKGNMISAAAATSNAISIEHQSAHGAPYNSDMRFSSGSNPIASHEIVVQHARETNDETIVVESGFQPPCSLNDNSSTSDGVNFRQSACTESCLALEEMTKFPNAIAGVNRVFPDMKIGECGSNLNHLNLCGETSKSSSVSNVESCCEGKHFHGTDGCKETVDFEEKKEAKYSKYDRCSLAEGSCHNSAEIYSDAEHTVHGCQDSEDFPIYSDTEHKIQLHVSHGGIINTTCSSLQRSQKEVHDLDLDAPELVDGDPCSAAALTTGPISRDTCMSDGLCKSMNSQPTKDFFVAEASSLALPVGVNHVASFKATHNLKEEVIAAESKSHSSDGDTPPEVPKFCSKSSQQYESGSQIDHPIVTPGIPNPSTTQAPVLV